MISLSKARFCDFSHRGYGNGFFWDCLVKLHDNSFQTPYSVSVGNFFEVRFQLIMLCASLIYLALLWHHNHCKLLLVTCCFAPKPKIYLAIILCWQINVSLLSGIRLDSAVARSPHILYNKFVVSSSQATFDFAKHWNLAGRCFSQTARALTEYIERILCIILHYLKHPASLLWKILQAQLKGKKDYRSTYSKKKSFVQEFLF